VRDGSTPRELRDGPGQRDRAGSARRDERVGPAQRDERAGPTQRDDRAGLTQRDGRAGLAQRDERAGPTQRQLRVAEEIRRVLAGVFARHEIRDPDLARADITVTEVRIGPDLKRAIAFVARLGRDDIDALLPALKRAVPFLRAQVALGVRLKFAPDLSFQPDRALDYAGKIDRLLHSPEVARDLDGSC
jgi:ribosome-binding factor A